MRKVALQKKEQISARFIAKMTGKLMSMSFVFATSVKSCPGMHIVLLRVAQAEMLTYCFLIWPVKNSNFG